VQTASAVAFVGAGILISLAYISIIYALCVAFGHVGQGLCVLLVIMQIPGASGLYPIG
jgi:putative membrane protein